MKSIYSLQTYIAAMWNKLQSLERRMRTIKYVLMALSILCLGILVIATFKSGIVNHNVSTTTIQTGHILDDVNATVNLNFSHKDSFAEFADDIIADKIENKSEKLSHDLLTEEQKDGWFFSWEFFVNEWNIVA